MRQGSWYYTQAMCRKQKVNDFRIELLSGLPDV